MNDPIANFIIQLTNAGKVRKASVVIPLSKMKQAIAEVLVQEKFIESFEVKDRNLHVALAYGTDGESKIQGVKRVSRSSKRVYTSADKIFPVKNGYGRLILTTPKGIMTGETAKKEKTGGEMLFKIW